MLKPPSQNVPGMTDTLEFVKNLWGGMGVPGVGMSGLGTSGLGVPTMSTDELDKRITDLKAVESWLNLNLSMLRTSIQALEVQRGTLAALKSMSESMTQAMGKAGEGGSSPFSAFFGAGGPQPVTQPGVQPGAAPGATPSGPAPADAAPDAMMPAAVAWWNLLQEQFRQAVASAMPADGASADKARAQPPADGANAATSGGDVGGTPGTSAPKPARTKADKS